MSNQKFVPLEEALKRFGNILLEDVAEGGKRSFTEADRAYYREHPVEFSRDILGNDPYDKQEEILLSVKNNLRTSVRSSHGIGKTWIAADAVLWFLSCFRPSTVVTTATVAKQVRYILWKEIASQYSRSTVALGGRILTQELHMSDTEKWFATGFTIEEHNVDAFQGYHNDNILVVIDEACGVADAIYGAVEGLLSSGEVPRLLLIGNPNNRATEFGKSFVSPIFNNFHLSAFDSPNFTTFGITLDDIRTTKVENGELIGAWKDKIQGGLPRAYLVKPDWVAGRYLMWGEDNPLWQVRVMGEFPEEDEFTLIPLAWLERAQNLELDPVGKKVFGIDIGRSGADESILVVRHGDVVTSIDSWVKHTTMDSVGIIKDKIDNEVPDIINIDSIGIGAGVVDRLDELKYTVSGVNVGSSSSDSDKYFNLRAELYWTLRERIEHESLSLPMDDLLVADLTTIKWEYTSKGQLKLEPKEQQKKRIGRSPDRGDALALSMYEKNEAMFIEDLSELNFEESPETKNDILKMYDPVILSFEADSDKCPSCEGTAGLVWTNDFEMTLRTKAKYGKCIICNAQWEV